MIPILIKPLTEQAYELLLQLEAFHILRLVNQLATSIATRRWAGSLFDTGAESLRQHLTESRSG